MTSVKVAAPEPHIEDPDLIGRRWRTGLLLLIFADGAFVASLMFSYLYLRGLNTEKAWLADGQDTAAIWVTWLITAGVLASALLFRWAEAGIRTGQEARFVTGAAAALAVLVVDAVVQVVQLVTLPFGIDTSAYSSSIYAIAGANLFHLLLTIFLGIAMVNRGRAHIYSATSHWQVRLVGIWWMWIAAAAVATAFATSFIASPNT
jgi:heme/copper-type cytochrome/quinol oxidase subunit 3